MNSSMHMEQMQREYQFGLMAAFFVTGALFFVSKQKVNQKGQFITSMFLFIT